jgi:subtilisin family serine protease
MRFLFKFCGVRLFAALQASIAGLLLIAAPSALAADTKPDEVLVKLRTPAALGPIVSQFNVVQSTQFGTRPIYRLKLPPNTNVGNVVNQLTSNSDVLLAEPNYTDQSPEARRNRLWSVGSASNYVAQWAPNAIHLTQAHTFTKGAGVRVAVLDTGVDATHPALAGKLLPGYNFVDDNTNTSEVGTAANLGFGHGTHVAGIVALTAPDAKIVPYRVLDENGEGNVWVLAEALLRAIDPDGNPATDDGAHVINLSLGTLNRTKILSTIAKLATCNSSNTSDPTTDFSHSGYDDDRTRCANGKGVVIVIAAGNDGVNNAEYPAAEGISGAISVGASDITQNLATFSNFGSQVDVTAPGDGITSSIPGGGYAVWSGTSMAAPMVAGAAALLRSREPSLPPKEITRRVIRSGARLVGSNLSQIDLAAVATPCSMDVDGDGQTLATTDGLILTRVMLGLKDAAVSSAAVTGSPRSTWDAINTFLTTSCGMVIP